MTKKSHGLSKSNSPENRLFKLLHCDNYVMENNTGSVKNKYVFKSKIKSTLTCSSWFLINCQNDLSQVELYLCGSFEWSKAKYIISTWKQEEVH